MSEHELVKRLKRASRTMLPMWQTFALFDEAAHALEAALDREKLLERQRDGCLEMAGARRPPESVFRYFRKLHGLDEEPA